MFPFEFNPWSVVIVGVLLMTSLVQADALDPTSGSQTTATTATATTSTGKTEKTAKTGGETIATPEKAVMTKAKKPVKKKGATIDKTSTTTP